MLTFLWLCANRLIKRPGPQDQNEASQNLIYRTSPFEFFSSHRQAGHYETMLKLIADVSILFDSNP